MKHKILIAAALSLAMLTSCDADNISDNDNSRVEELEKELKNVKDELANVKNDKVANENSLPKEFEGEEELVEGKESESLKDTYLGYIQVEGEMSDSSIVFNESINMIKNDPSFLIDDDAANSLGEMFNSVYWDELNLDPNVKQPITLVEGDVLREFDNTLGGPYNVYKTVMSPTIGDSTNVFITIYYCGNTANYNSLGANGKGILKVWALPVGVYYKKADDGTNYTNYVYVSGESIQHAAYNLFGEWWNN